GKPREALADWDRAVALSAGAQRQELRLRRADTLVRLKEHGKAAAEALRLAPSPTLHAANRYNLACLLALCGAAAARDAALPLPLRERLAEAHARRAVGQLSLADRAGYFKQPANREHLDRDGDLDSLRDRADFRAFVSGLRAAK